MITFLRVVASFATVGLLLWFLARASGGKLGSFLRGARNGAGEAVLDVVDRQQLTRSTGIAVIRAGERHLLVGISETGVQMLAEGDDLAAYTEPLADSLEAPLTDESATGEPSSSDKKSILSFTSTPKSARTRSWTASAPSPARMNIFAALREMTVRRS